VVAEPFASWILSGDFPAGRPAWEDAGAQFVADLEPFENRKLWLFNGAHTMLAYSGRLRGHETVADALEDPVCRRAVAEFWDEAARHLTLPELDVPSYRAALLERFANPRIATISPRSPRTARSSCACGACRSCGRNERRAGPAGPRPG
ncbi:mannitol dehydrogenase family protein, partial [Sinomonas humi]